MYSSKKNIQQLVALMLGHGVTNVVLSPGSRNAPLIHTFTRHPDFTCYTIVDERSASYFALGLMLKLQQPVAVCCTSGTALLNYSSATAEAFYQKLPLLVISADRPQHWVGQADGQTINQQNVLANFVRRSITLPEVHTDEDLWLCNRRANEALLALTVGNVGPVHINIPLSEPLYDFSAEVIPQVRKVRLIQGKAEVPTAFVEAFGAFTKKMVVVGQLQPNSELTHAIELLSKRNDVVIIAEHTANLSSGIAVERFEEVLASSTSEGLEPLIPELLITLGGHIVSKRLKQFLRKNSPVEHWHIGNEVVDTYQCLTDVIDVLPLIFIKKIVKADIGITDYCAAWHTRSLALYDASVGYLRDIVYCDLSVMRAIYSAMPARISLHLGNSTPVRYAQLFRLPIGVEAFSNRGTSGIDGVVSTFTGYSVGASHISLLIVGELSFLYDSNGLWNRYLSPKCRIVVINNGGGGIFRLIDGPSRSEALEQHIEYRHGQSVRSIAEAFGVRYLAASSQQEVEQQLKVLFDEAVNVPVLLEIFTPSDVNASIYKGYFEYLKTK